MRSLDPVPDLDGLLSGLRSVERGVKGFLRLE
jgi:hypothetical protein